MEVEYKVEYDRFLVKPKHPVIFAFESGGKPFFEYESWDNIPIARRWALEDLDDLNNLGRLTADDVVFACEAWAEAHNDGRKADEGIIINNLKERAAVKITTLEYFYHKAAIRFFSYDENPTSYDPDKAEKKVAHWRKHDDVDGFFLKTQMVKPSISLGTIIEDFLSYTRADRNQKIKELNFLYFNIPSGGNKSDLKNAILYRIEQEKALKQLGQ